MTINATAMWLLGMYLALADEQGVPHAAAVGHDAERHPEGVPVARHVHLPARSVEAAHRRPHRVHGEERARRGTRSTSARTTCRKRARRRCRSSRTGSRTRSRCSTRCASPGRSPTTSSHEVVGRISFFIDAGVRFVEEMCKMRAFTQMWDDICRERYGVDDEKLRRFRYGMQVNSLGLTEEQPENNVQRIVLEMLGVTLSKDARARADPTAVLERGARAADAVGPAVVAAHPAGARVRVRPARVRRPVRRFGGRRAQGRRAARSRRGRAAVGARRRRLVRDDRRDEGPARAERTPSACGASSRASRRSSA